LLADKNPRELGAVSETKLLAVGEAKLLAVSEVELFDELKGLEKPEQQILLDAAILRFLQHNLCFRETLGNSSTSLTAPTTSPTWCAGAWKTCMPCWWFCSATRPPSPASTSGKIRRNTKWRKIKSEMYLSRIKGFRRGWATPRCYLSRLPEQAEWAAELIHDLNDAGVYVVEQAGHV
jgi:hypothetical protein